MEVYSVPWRNSIEIQWDKSTCIKPVAVGSKETVEIDQDIVNFVFTQLSYGECEKNDVTIDNFQKQVYLCLVGNDVNFDNFELLFSLF